MLAASRIRLPLPQSTPGRVRDPDRIRIGIGSLIFLDVSRSKTDEATLLPGLPDASSAHTLPTRRSSALYLSWLAEDYVQLGEIDHAADIAMRMAALAARTNSARTDARLRYIARRLDPYNAIAGVADFLDVYRTSATVQQAPHSDED